VYPGDGVYNNPWAQNFSTRDDHRISVVLMNLMKSKSDPRIPIYSQPTPADSTGGSLTRPRTTISAIAGCASAVGCYTIPT